MLLILFDLVLLLLVRLGCFLSALFEIDSLTYFLADKLNFAIRFFSLEEWFTTWDRILNLNYLMTASRMSLSVNFLKFRKKNCLIKSLAN